MATRQPITTARDGVADDIINRLGGTRQSDLNAIQNVLFAAYVIKGSEVFGMESVAERRALLAYQSEITRRIAEIGCSGQGSLPTGIDRDKVTGQSTDGIKGAVDNFNNMLKKQVKQITAKNPNARRTEYRAQLDAWSTRRLQIVNKLITEATRFNAVAYASEQFIKNNSLTTELFVYDGKHPNGQKLLQTSSAECIARVAAGEVDYQYTQENKTPNHPRCPHKWVLARTVRRDCRKVWRG